MARTASEQAAELYQTLKQYCIEVQRDRRLASPPAQSATVHSPQCGSRLTLDARIEGKRICEIGYKVRACSLGQATTAIVARRAPGLDGGALERVAQQLRSILAGTGGKCDWPELDVFASARDMPSRHGSALLPFDALQKLFDRADNRVVPVDRDVDVTSNPSGRN